MGTRRALIIATSTYDDARLRPLDAPAVDAEQLAATLGDPRIGAFSVTALVDATSQQARIAIEELFAKSDPDDTALLHFSCHGLKDSSGKLALIAKDTDHDLLASTAVGADFVSAQMLKSRARESILLLDCCYGGAFERGVVARAGGDAHVGEAFQDQEQLRGGRGSVVITSSTALQYAFEGGQLVDGTIDRPSVFTGALIGGLASGDADRDEDGHVSATELFHYLRDQIAGVTPHQTPQMWAFGSESDVIIARSPRRNVKPAPLPPDLDSAWRDSDAFRRGGAVGELERLLRGDDVRIALTACHALLTLADDDSRRVAMAASGALQRTLDLLEIDDEVALGPRAGASTDLATKGPPLLLATLRADEDPSSTTVVDVTDDGLRLARTQDDTAARPVILRCAVGARQLMVVAAPELTYDAATAPAWGQYATSAGANDSGAGWAYGAAPSVGPTMGSLYGLPTEGNGSAEPYRSATGSYGVPTFPQEMLADPTGGPSFPSPYVVDPPSRSLPPRATRWGGPRAITALCWVVATLQLLALIVPYQVYNRIPRIYLLRIPLAPLLAASALNAIAAVSMIRAGDAQRRWNAILAASGLTYLAVTAIPAFFDGVPILDAGVLLAKVALALDLLLLVLVRRRAGPSSPGPSTWSPSAS